MVSWGKQKFIIHIEFPDIFLYIEDISDDCGAILFVFDTESLDLKKGI